MVLLTVRRDGKEVRRCRVGAGRTTLGRLRENDVVLPDLSVSRKHAEVVVREEDRAVVRDLGSSNHVYVNGRLVRECRLRHGDMLGIGRFEVLFEISGDKGSRRSTVEFVAAELPPNAIVRRSDERIALGEKRLRYLYQVSNAVAATLDEEELLKNLVDRVFELFDVERGLIALVDREGGPLAYREVRNVGRDSAGAFQVSQGIVDCVLQDATSVLVSDALADDRYAGRRSVMTQRIRSVLCVPLAGKQSLIGLIYLDNRKRKGVFTEEDLEFLTILGRQVGLALESARMHRAELAMERLAGELQTAHSIQQGLLPAVMPAVPGWSLCGTNVPTQEVGGDYYDVVDLGAGRVGVVIADVSGKGMPAALLMANAQATFRSLAFAMSNTAELVRQMNHHICRSFAADRFITLFYAVFEPAAGTLRYCNAGHNYPYVLRPGGVTEAVGAGGGPPLGAFESFEYQEFTADTGDSTGLFFYTDGVTDAMNSAGERYGRARLEGVLGGLRGPAAGQVARAFESVEEFAGGAAQPDDITILVVSRGEARPAPDPLSAATQPVPPPRG